MAALPESPAVRVVDLRRVPVEHLVPVLNDEISAWRAELDWDLSPSVELVRRFVGMQALQGFALLEGSRVTGYAYHVCEDGKGLVGGAFVRDRRRATELEHLLLEAVLEGLWRTPGVRRVESQLLMLTQPLQRRMPFASWLRVFPRWFLELPTRRIAQLPERRPNRASIEPWMETLQSDAARLIGKAYQGHIDSQINDQYRSTAGAQRFLTNIVQFPGCGIFFGPGSCVAIDTFTGELCGLCLSSKVAHDVGHITQVCVAPAHQGTGLGYELMRRSLISLAEHGCRSVSLTVTAANEAALRLYESMGFARRRAFAAHIWEMP